MSPTMVKANARLTLDQMDLSTGKKARLYRFLYEHGPGNGTMLFLPIDQGLEHGPLNFFENPESADPDFQCRLALEAGYSGIVFHIGLAEKYMKQYAGRVPLCLKINGKTNVPSDDNAFSPLTGSVEDAVRLGADAVGYTLYVGSPSQDRDIRQFNEVRKEAERFGIPTIMWAYPRGTAIEAKGGRDSLYAVDYAARVACELGADVVKINFPKIESAQKDHYPKPYNTVDLGFEETVQKVVRSAGRTMVLFSGGSKVGDEDLLSKAQTAMNAGATGLIFGRNMWQRPMNEALSITARVKDMMRSL
ncbi:MAG: fructose-bisphosphate aldolase [Cyanobacteria bacterium]|nr:fructose-bisphosphate aldolase [Cyanobacteriota bacterium]